jgi:hypothetical protein
MSDVQKVKVSLGYTLNLGNFESLRIDVGVEDRVIGDENIDSAMERTYKYVEELLTIKVSEAKAELNGE